MSPELSKRFRYEGGKEMNGFFIFKFLTEIESNQCLLLTSTGPLGLNKQEVESDTNLDLSVIEDLVTEGVIRKETRLKMASEFVEKEVSTYKELVDEGGFLALDEGWEKTLFSDYETALEIVEQGETLENLTKQYQARSQLYTFIELLLPQ